MEPGHLVPVSWGTKGWRRLWQLGLDVTPVFGWAARHLPAKQPQRSSGYPRRQYRGTLSAATPDHVSGVGARHGGSARAGIPPVCGPLIEPFATVLYGQRLLEQIGSPKSMAVVGAGPIGLLNALYARKQGCAQTFLVDTSQARLDWAVQRGIVAGDQALLNSPQLVETLLERTAGQGVDATYLCTPRSATRAVLRQALAFVREGGGISLTAGSDSSEELAELPRVDLDAIRRANVCGLGHEVRACVTRGRKEALAHGS